MRDFANGYSAFDELDKLADELKIAASEKDEEPIGAIILNMLWTICNEHDNPRVVAAGDREFLFDTEKKASVMADIIELAGNGYARIGYYDPEEDEREGCVDDFTGKWYASWD
jgi:hypothetical protein